MKVAIIKYKVIFKLFKSSELSVTVFIFCKAKTFLLVILLIHKVLWLCLEITEYQAIIDELRLTVEVSEKECKIKEMALLQRDAEVERLNRLNG